MKLGTYAHDIINRARANGYATDASKASDPLNRPFGEFDEQRASLRALQQTTIGLCWVNAEGKAVPFNETEFAGNQKEIVALKAKNDQNAEIL